MRKNIITCLLLLVIALRVGLLIYSQRAKFLPDYWHRYPTLKSVFGQSQYMTKQWKYWIPDETVYSYAAGAYVSGANPILVESTQPPLGKYLIGVSILLTHNENIGVQVFFVLLLSGIFLLSVQLTGSIIWSLFIVLLASFERLFTDQLAVTPLLDIFFITFELFGLVAASYAIEKKRPVFLLLSYGLFGMAMMIKVWVIGVVFVIPITIYLLLRNRSYILYIVGGFLIILGITLLSYFRMFMEGYNVLQVLKVQKYLYWYQNGKRNRLFTIWPLIFLNRWYVWWGETAISYDPHWSISWPIFIGAGFLTSIKVLFMKLKRASPALHISALSILSYSAFISLGQPSARYLLPLLPVCYPLAGWALQRSMYKFSFIKKIK